MEDYSYEFELLRSRVACIMFAMLLLLRSVPATFACQTVALDIRVKPIKGPDVTVAFLEVWETINQLPVRGELLILKAAHSAIVVQHIADSVMDLTLRDDSRDVELTETDDAPVTSDASAYRQWRVTRVPNS